MPKDYKAPMTDSKASQVKENQIDFTDIPELGAVFFQNARLLMPQTKEQISLRLDGDVLEWFRGQGKGYQSQINAVLRAYMASQVR